MRIFILAMLCTLAASAQTMNNTTRGQSAPCDSVFCNFTGSFTMAVDSLPVWEAKAEKLIDAMNSFWWKALGAGVALEVVAAIIVIPTCIYIKQMSTTHQQLVSSP